MKLSRNKMLLVSFMLFSLFFGAGNLIFPPFLGQNAGSHTLPAMLGFLATAVVLPGLGVVGVARCDGLDRLGQQVGKRFAIVFTLLIYLSIGPGLGIPRAASVPFEMAVAPYLPEGTNTTVWMLVYSLAFILVALWLSMTPGKLVNRLGHFLQLRTGKQLQIDQYLVVTRTAAMNFLADIAQFTGQHQFHLRVYILDTVLDDKRTGLGRRIDLFQFLQQDFQFVGGQQADTFQHGNMCHGTQHIVFCQIQVHLAVTSHRETVDFLVHLDILLPKFLSHFLTV